MLSKKLLLILAVIPILFASTIVGEVWEEFDRRDPSSWTRLNTKNSSGNCMGEDFIKCYENILEYVTLGTDAIKISEEKKAIVVIGLTRVGKSTLTQFIANETNPLFVSCAGTMCQLIDDSGDGSDSVVSKTFVPNTVEDQTTNGVLTPFYDMPGFDDTRNISVEIANSFFIQKVINNIEKVKIVVVAKHASFSSTETTFKTLLTFLIKFSKDPAKFRNSIVLISNFGEYADEDFFHFQDMRRYMLAYNASMYGEESSHPDPQERATATAWINCFLDAPEEDPDNLQRAAVFRTPRARLNGTSIRNDSIYQKDYVLIKHRLWNETLFTPITPSDIGFTLSTEAELFLERATRESDTSIKNNLNGFALRTKTYLENVINKMKTETTSRTGMASLRIHIKTLQNLDVSYCNNSAVASPRECINQVEHQLHSIAAEMDDLIFTDINKTTNYLQFVFESIGKEKEYNMEDWINRVLYDSVSHDTDLHFNNTALDMTYDLSNACAHLAEDAHSHILLKFEELSRGKVQGTIHKLNLTVTEVLSMEDFTFCTEHKPNGPVSCFKEIIDKTKMIRELTNNNLETKLQPLATFLELACIEADFCLEFSNWANELMSLKRRVVDSLEQKSIPQNISNILLEHLTDAAVKLKFEILHDVPNSYASITDLLNHLMLSKNAAERISRSLETYNTTDSLHGYADTVVCAYREFSNASATAGVFLDGIYVIERLMRFPWYSPAWINFHRNSLTLPVLLEWRVLEFQSALFKNLAAPNVQVDDVGAIHQWRLENTNIEEENFDQFWNKFEELGIEAIQSFSRFREDIKGHLSNNEYTRKWLNLLLDYTLKRSQITCPTAESGIVIFDRKFMTLQFIYNCLKTYSVKPSTIVALAENTFFFDISFENLGIPHKYKIFIVARNFDFTRGQRINFNGKDGEPPMTKPATPSTPGANGVAGKRGDDGKEAGDFIGVYLEDIGNSSRVDITCYGGRGGDGQDGGNGADSRDTTGPNLPWRRGWIIDNYQCAAWISGQIRVKIYPNTCNPGESTTCDGGTWVNICGDVPGSPGTKGRGGMYGTGGSGGSKVFLNVTNSVPSIVRYPVGSIGRSGRDGNDGRMGSRGAMEVNIGIQNYNNEPKCRVDSDITNNAKCRHFANKLQYNISLPEPISIEVQERHDNPSEKLESTVRTTLEKSIVYPLDEFKLYVKVLLDSVEKSLNIFNRNDMTSFLDFVKSNPLLVENL